MTHLSDCSRRHWSEPWLPDHTEFGTRYYDPSVGRWTQQDPSGIDDHYVYSGNSPLNFTDPSGYLFGVSFSGDCGLGLSYGDDGCVGGSVNDVDFVEKRLLGLAISAGVGSLCVAIAAAITTGGTAGLAAPAFITATKYCGYAATAASAAARS